MAGDLRLQFAGDENLVEGSGLELSREGAAWRPTNVAATLKRRDGRIAAVVVRADYLRIENLAALASLLPEGPLRTKLETLAPRGELFGLDVAVAGRGTGLLPDINGRVRFTGLGFEAFDKAPGLQGLDGSIEARGAGGVARSRRVTRRSPGRCNGAPSPSCAGRRARSNGPALAMARGCGWTKLSSTRVTDS